MWMFGIARRVLATQRRGLSRRLALADRLRSEIEGQPSAAALDGSTPTVPKDDRLEVVMTSMTESSDSDREIIMLVHFDGFTTVEAARHLRLRATTARSRYHRARNRLKDRVETALAAQQESLRQS